MPRGSHHTLSGLLLHERGHYWLRMDNGGEWQLDVSPNRALLGRRVTVTGLRDTFNILAVETIDAV